MVDMTTVILPDIYMYLYGGYYYCYITRYIYICMVDMTTVILPDIYIYMYLYGGYDYCYITRYIYLYVWWI